jgi:hypothetical protein
MLYKLITAAAEARLRILLPQHCLRLISGLKSPNPMLSGSAALAGLLVALAYPRRLISIALFVVAFATALKALQLTTPDRHMVNLRMHSLRLLAALQVRHSVYCLTSSHAG